MSAITLPNKWKARPHQESLFQYMFSDGTMQRKRAVEVWHRRAGKDSCSLQLCAIASQQRVGVYWHMLPTAKQGRKVIWEGIDKFGRRMIDQAFPKEIRASVNDTEMRIKLKNGSIYQVVGSDNYDSLVGSNPVGVIMSEYSIADPTAWDYIRPILAENGGWAIFIYTSRGKNHGYNLYNMAKNNPNWHCELLTVDDTKDRDGNPIVSPEVIEEERQAGMSEEKIQQEFYCSWDIGMEGAFYTKEINDAYAEGRIGAFPHDPLKPVQTWWDIGFRDATSVIFTQDGDNGKPILINYMEKRNMGLPDLIREVKSYPYNYDVHNGPHDIEQTDFSTGKTRREMARSLGFNFDVVPKLGVADGIDATRAMLRVCRIDETSCAQLISGLASYQREYDEKTKIFKDKPLHNWASHPADAARYLSVGWDRAMVSTTWTPEKSAMFRRKHKVKRAYGG
jgi:phage terminase large subunit